MKKIVDNAFDWEVAYDSVFGNYYLIIKENSEG